MTDIDERYFASTGRNYLIRFATREEADRSGTKTKNLMALVRRGPPVEIILTNAGEFHPSELCQWEEGPCRQFFEKARAAKTRGGRS